jgi:hypothetical protein
MNDHAEVINAYSKVFPLNELRPLLDLFFTGGARFGWSSALDEVEKRLTQKKDN